MGRAQRKLMARGTAVFTYHKIGFAPEKTRDPFLYASPESFERQLSALSRESFRTARLGELIAHRDPTDRKAVITFDDGFRSAFENGLEILARRQASAIQFIVSGLIGKRNEWDVEKQDAPEPLMDAAQIKEWLAAGHEIGSHSARHRNLKRLSPAEAHEEISGSKKFLEDKFGVEVRHFAYPFGGWNPQARDLVAAAGYRSACTVIFGVNDAATDPFALRRIVPLSSAELLRKIIHRLVRQASGRNL